MGQENRLSLISASPEFLEEEVELIFFVVLGYVRQ